MNHSCILGWKPTWWWYVVFLCVVEFTLYVCVHQGSWSVVSHFILSLSGFGRSRQANSTECIWYILFLSVLRGAFKSLLFVLFRDLLEGNHKAIYSGLFCLRSHSCFCLISCQGICLSSWVVLYVIYVSHPSPKGCFVKNLLPTWSLDGLDVPSLPSRVCSHSLIVFSFL